HFRRGCRELAHCDVGTDGRELATGDRDRFGDRKAGVDGDDVAVDEDRFGRRSWRLRADQATAENDRDGERSDHFAAALGVRSVPIPSISIVTTSPAFRNSGGLRPAPTPSGVPLEITSPG